MDRHRVVFLSSKEETVLFGKEFVKTLFPGTVLALSGDLGSGKTTFVQGLGIGLDVNDPIQSPTYIYLNEYQGSLPLSHFDLYRLNGEREFINLGFEEYLEPSGICAIEWPERISSLIPEKAIRLNFSHKQSGRTVEIHS